MPSKRAGALTVVGTGISAVNQTSAEAVDRIKTAQRVYFVTADPLTEQWLRDLNDNCESLHGLYAPGKLRRQTYEEMVERILTSVRSGDDVCFVSYGHPGVFASPMHESIRRARREGYAAQMLPAVSAEDCLFADLGIDPGDCGCQSFEATDFLIRRRAFDPHSSLILWQIGAIGIQDYRVKYDAWNPTGLDILIESLLETYPHNHEVTVYEAARYACCDPKIERTSLDQLKTLGITPLSTLYVPPRSPAPLDTEVLERLTR